MKRMDSKLDYTVRVVGSSQCEVGILNSDFSAGSPGVVAFNRGGTWNNGPNSGLFTLNLENTPSDFNPNIGFRAALPGIPNIAR